MQLGWRSLELLPHFYIARHQRQRFHNNIINSINNNIDINNNIIINNIDINNNIINSINDDYWY